MSSFNIIVDLSEFFQDERKVAYVYVDENYDHIIDLEKRICNIFSINKKICLTKEGVLLPSCESIFLLQNQDCITAVAVSDEFHINIPKTSRPERDIKIVDVIPISQFNDNNNIKPPQAKKTKKSPTSCNNLPKQPAAGGSGDGVGVDTQEHAISQSKLQIPKDISLCTTPGLTTAAKSFPEIELSVPTVEEFVRRPSQVQEREQPSFVTKRKRKRTRNRSAKNIPDNSGIRESMFCSTPLHQQTATVTKTSSNHIRFDQPSSPATKDVESVCNKTTEAFHIIKPRIIPAMTPCVGVSRRNGAGFDGNTEDSASNIANDTTSTLTNINKTMGPDEIKYLWDNFKTDDHPPMKTLPDENDVIAFKMYKMTDMYEPYISEHIFALVVSINDDKVELQLLAGHESKKKQVGKFDLPPEDNETIDVDTSESSITMAWKDIIEPRKMC